MKLTTCKVMTALLLLLSVLSLCLEVTSGQNTAGVTRRPPRRRPSGGRASRTRTRPRGRGATQQACEEIYLPMCKDFIGYTHTKLPNAFNHTTQQEVYEVLEHLWAYMDHACSANMRLLICTTYLPKCRRRGPALGPCKRTCMTAKRKCARPLQQLLGLDWAEKFPCAGLPSRRCIKPVRDTTCPRPYPHPNCVDNSVISVCTNLTFTVGTLPNMFHQCHTNIINTEVAQYNALIASNCHQDLRFFICGVYAPFCVRNEVPFSFPCREICEEIRDACEPHYRRLYHNLPWPNKLQCHRYPNTTSTDFQCVMPHEGNIYRANSIN